MEVVVPLLSYVKLFDLNPTRCPNLAIGPLQGSSQLEALRQRQRFPHLKLARQPVEHQGSVTFLKESLEVGARARDTHNAQRHKVDGSTAQVPRQT